MQGDLWAAPDTAKSKALMHAVDRLNGNHGLGTVRFPVLGFQQRWKLRSEERSPHYTSDRDELLLVGGCSWRLFQCRLRTVNGMGGRGRCRSDL